MNPKTASITTLRCLGFSTKMQTLEDEWIEVHSGEQLEIQRKQLSISIFTPEQIRKWSNGCVVEPSLITPGRQRIRGGLLCERIFDNRPGTPMFPSGHIEFACPIPHPFLFSGSPSVVSLLLDMEESRALKVALGQVHVVTATNTAEFQIGHEVSPEDAGDQLLCGTGESAINQLLEDVEITSASQRIQNKISSTDNAAKRMILQRRFRMLLALFGNGGPPEGIFIHALPVLPAKLRMLQRNEAGGLEIGAINEAYSKVIACSRILHDRCAKGYAFGMPILAAKHNLFIAVSELFHLPQILDNLASELSEFIHDLGVNHLSNFDTSVYEQVAPDPNPIDYVKKFADAVNEIGETELIALGKQRIGQNIYRHQLVEYWHGCAITGLSCESILRASHAKPWKDCGSDKERLDVFNGFLLAPHFDVLFDRGLMTFEDSGSVKFSSKLSPMDLEILGLKGDCSLRTKPESGHLPYLEWHRKYVFIP